MISADPVQSGDIASRQTDTSSSSEQTWLHTHRRDVLVAFLSLLIILPCIWQPRIHSLDLPSHTYNAWLASVLQRQPVEGVILTSPRTNIVFDMLLAGTAKITGFAAAETIAVVVAVLIFFWGCFALIARINGSVNWACVPLLAVLTYGLIFRLGFFNFYIATGLCCAAIATLKASSSRRLIVAALLAAASVCANPMPVAYAIGAMTYVVVLRRLRSRLQLVLPSAAAVMLILSGQVLAARFPSSSWSLDRLFSLPALLTFFGMDQLWVYGDRYFLLGFASVVIVLLGVSQWLRSFDFNLSYPIFHLLALNIVLMNALPSAILFPAYKTPLAFLPDRISLFSAVLVCCLIARSPVRPWIHGAFVIIFVTFFAFTLRDDIAQTRFNAEVQRAVNTVPSGSRVIASIIDPKVRLDSLLHLIDRACLGRCFSYGNYEPVSGHFRVKAIGQNKVVLASADAVKQVEMGTFLVRAADGPVYAVCDCADSSDRFCAIKLKPGERMCSVRASLTGW